MKNISNEFQALDVRGMMRLLQFAMLGIAKELREQQDRIILQERFNKDSVLFPSMHNPNRFDSDDEIAERMKRYEDLLLFSKNIQQMLDHVKDVDMEHWAEGVKQYFATNGKK